jgi:hypothetical protein
VSDIVALFHDLGEPFIDILELDDHQEILGLEQFKDGSRQELGREVVEPADLNGKIGRASCRERVLAMG